MIQLSKLQSIKTPSQFFNTNKVLMIDLLDLGPSHKAVAQDIGDDAFTYRGTIYLPIVTVGSPENFFLNCRNGVPFQFKSGIKGLYKWDGDLNGAITERKVFDFTDYYKAYKAGNEVIDKEIDFLTDRYIQALQTA